MVVKKDEVIENTETEIPSIGCDYKDSVSSLGIGLVLMPGKCKFYNDATLTQLYMEWNISESYDPPKQACALYYKPDYGIAHYVCLDSTAKYYHILINGNQQKYIPRIYGKIFEDWFTYISGSVGGINFQRPRKDFALILYDSPGGSNPVYTDRSMESASTDLCPLEMQGDWLKVKIDCYDFDENPHQGDPCQTYIMNDCKETKEGWIRWRRDNKVLIEIHQLM